MRVLLVEDDENKRRRIASFYIQAFPDDELKFADALVSGINAARRLLPNLVLLDMTIPNYSEQQTSGYNPMRPFGGREFLRKVSRLRVPTKVVVITQFETFGSPPDVVTLDTLDSELMLAFPEYYLGAIYYHASQSSWQGELDSVRRSIEGREI